MAGFIAFEASNGSLDKFCIVDFVHEEQGLQLPKPLENIDQANILYSDLCFI